MRKDGYVKTFCPIPFQTLNPLKLDILQSMCRDINQRRVQCVEKLLHRNTNLYFKSCLYFIKSYKTVLGDAFRE